MFHLDLTVRQTIRKKLQNLFYFFYFFILILQVDVKTKNQKSGARKTKRNVRKQRFMRNVGKLATNVDQRNAKMQNLQSIATK